MKKIFSTEIEGMVYDEGKFNIFLETFPENFTMFLKSELSRLLGKKQAEFSVEVGIDKKLKTFNEKEFIFVSKVIIDENLMVFIFSGFLNHARFNLFSFGINYFDKSEEKYKDLGIDYDTFFQTCVSELFA